MISPYEYEKQQRADDAEERYWQEIERFTDDIHNVVDTVCGCCPNDVKFNGLRMSELAELTLLLLKSSEAEDAVKDFCHERYMTELEKEWR